MGQFVSEAFKAHDVLCHGVIMFPFHGQSGPIQGLAEKFFGSRLKMYHQSLKASSVHPEFTARADFLLQLSVCLFQMCSDYEKSLVQPAYENDGLGPRALPETHPLLQDWQVRG